MSGWRTLFPNAWYIAVREYRSRASSRSFLIGTALLAAIAFFATQSPVLIDAAMGSSQTRIEVVVRASGVAPSSQAVLDSVLNGQSTTPDHDTYVITWLTAGDLDSAQQDLKNGKYQGLLIVDRDQATHNLAFTFKTDLAADGRVVQTVASAAKVVEISDVLVRAGTTVDPYSNTQFALEPVTASTGTTNSISQELSANLLATGLIVLIFMAIITYGTWVAMSVAEEKGSRVMELMLNATTPLQMLAGKVIGNGVAGLTQYGLILGAVVVGLVAQGPVHQAVLGTSAGAPFGGLQPVVLAAFAVLFALGFLFYSLLYAALGSLVSRQEDVQSATSPLMMLIMIGYFMSIFGLQAINEPWVRVASFIPFFSPYLMLARVAMGHVEPWEFALAVALLLAALAVALVAAARIYSAGVLLYGQRVGIRQVLKAARVSR
jgi:ABC-2 type transport system permease protein